MKEKSIAIFWLRRDLRLFDNAALFHALRSGYPVLPLFIFDKEILDKLDEKRDARVQFIHRELKAIQTELKKFGSDLLVIYDKPTLAWKAILETFNVAQVYANRDYEPYARLRDGEIGKLLQDRGIEFHTFKDHVIFEPEEILKNDGTPYVVYSPYSRKWLGELNDEHLKSYSCEPYYDGFLPCKEEEDFPTLESMGFEEFDFSYPERNLEEELVRRYAERRDIPSVRGTSRLSLHLRFGTVSIREITRIAKEGSNAFLNELIWRNFYQMIIWHFPHSATRSFRPEYDRIPWRNDVEEFNAWCEGRTGYPIVDAGMRELNKTGFMHNRVRMITASFLTKHLLIDWRWGEAYFAKKLLDFELASNNGGWQWAAGSGCDAAPYFRVFNPELQTKKFDPEGKYIRKWVPEVQEFNYPKPIVDHKKARTRAIDVYKSALKQA